MRAWTWAVVLGLLAGCGNDSPCETKGMGDGDLLGTLDDDLWTAKDVGWSATSTGIVISSNSSGGHAVTVFLFNDVEGRSVVEARNDHDYPIEVVMDDEGLDAGGIFVHSTGNEMSGHPGGWARIDKISGGVLQGCFGFEASDDFDTVELEASIRAEML